MSSFPPGTGLSHNAFSIISGITRTVGEMYVVDITVSFIRIEVFSWLLIAKITPLAGKNNKETDSNVVVLEQKTPTLMVSELNSTFRKAPFRNFNCIASAKVFTFKIIIIAMVITKLFPASFLRCRDPESHDTF